MIRDAFQSLSDRIYGLESLLTSNQSRSFWGYLLATAGIAFIVWFIESTRRAAAGDATVQRSPGAFLKYLFPKQVYAHPSFRLDLKLMLFLHLAVPAGWFLEGWMLTSVSDYVSDGLDSLFGGAVATQATPSMAAKIGLGVLLFVASDFARFFNHFLHHNIPALWQLHTVHHSAEHLNPLTTYRFHPIEMFFENLSVVLFVGTLAGLVESLLGGNPLTYYGTIYAWAYLRAANALGTNLRHMHVWWAWNPKLSHFLISPAQHQIHHSTDPKHYDKNFGFFFGIWDWMFGTLYVPKEKEVLTFGLTDGTKHRSLVGALVTPLTRAAGIKPRPRSDEHKAPASLG
ncbi:sterol desaturase family protein [soil metagenome]